MKLAGQYGRFRAELEYETMAQNGAWLADCILRVYMNDKPTMVPPCYPQIKYDKSAFYCCPPEYNRACNGYRYLVMLNKRDDAELERTAVRIIMSWLAGVVFMFEEGYTVLNNTSCSKLTELCKELEHNFVTWQQHFEKAKEVIYQWCK